MGRKIVLKRPDGSSIVADETDAKSLSKLGYTPESTEETAAKITENLNKEQFSGLGSKILTATEGLASGLSFGLSDLRADEESQLRAKYNPGTRIGTEILGAIIPTIATGGASAEVSAAEIGGKLALREAAGVGKAALSVTPAGLVARGGRAIESAIGGTRGAVAAGAFEGTVGGMGAAITQAKLNDDPLTIESVLSSGGIGGLIGGGVGGVASRLGKVKPAVERLDDAADNITTAASREADTLDEFYKSLPKDKVEDVPMWKAVPQDKPYAVERVTDSVEEAVFQPIESFGNVRKSLDTPIKNIDEASKLVDKHLQEASSTFSQLEGDISTFTSKVEGIKGINKAEFKNPVAKLKRAIKTRNPDGIDEALTDYISTLENQLGKPLDPARKQGFISQIEGFKKAGNSAKELIKLKEAASILKDFPDKVEDFRKLRAAKAEKLFAALDVIGENTEFSAITRDLDTTLEHMGLSADGSAGNKARTIWESSKSPGFFKNENRAVERVRLNLEPSVDESVLKTELGGSAGPVKGAPISAAVSPEDALIAKQNPVKAFYEPKLDLTPGNLDINLTDINTGDVVASDMVRAGVPRKKVHGFWKRAAESAGRRVSSSMARKIGLGALGSAVAFEAGGSATDMLIGGMFGSTVAGSRTSTVGRISQAARRAAPSIGKGLSKTYGAFGRLTTRLDGTEDTKPDAKARIDEVNNFVPTARDKAFSAVEDLAMDHPEFVKAFIDTVDNFAKTLQSLLPKDPGLAFSSGKSLWDLDPVQKIQTGKVFAVAHDPVATAEHIASGNADMFTIKAYKALWPAQQQEFVVGIMDNLVQTGKINDMSYEEQNYYSTVTGIPFHSSMSPRSMAQTQAVYAAAGERERAKRQEMGGQTQKGGRPAKTEPPTTGQSLLA